MAHPNSAEAVARSQIGPYHVVRELGRGGMGVVYEAVHEHLRRRVAIKLMLPELARDPQYLERFVREARAACNIRHPHVIEVYEFAFVDDMPYLVMDYLEGETLAERLRAVGRLMLPELLEYALPILSAVSAAHRLGIVHRDLKPGNIMLANGPDGRVIPKVLDFGTAKWLAHKDLTLTESAAFLGTPYYMAPEQARSARNAGAHSDQYALGVILYECATGQRPFEGGSPYEVLHALMTAPVEPPSQRSAGLPKAFDLAVLRAMQREPAQRFASVDALATALTACASAVAPSARQAADAARMSDSRPSCATLQDALPLTAADRARRGRLAPRLIALGLATIGLVAALWLASLRGVAPPPSTASARSPIPNASVPQRQAQGTERLAGNTAPSDTPSPALQAPGALVPTPSLPTPAPTRTEMTPPTRAASASGKHAASRRRSERPSAVREQVTLGDNGAPILE